MSVASVPVSSVASTGVSAIFSRIASTARSLALVFFQKATIPAFVERAVPRKRVLKRKSVPRTEAVATGERTVKPTRRSCDF